LRTSGIQFDIPERQQTASVCCTRSCYDARWLYGAATSAGIKHRSVEEARKLGIVWRAIDSFSVKRVDIAPPADLAEVSGHFAFPSCSVNCTTLTRSTEQIFPFFSKKQALEQEIPNFP
jgi:hypothetical protein